jgi:hypothetical protein
MSDHQRYGPAGLFSTDNPQSDRMQIEAESYDDEFDERDPGGWYEYYNQPTVYRTFECSVYGASTWFDWEECFESDNLVAMARSKQVEHDKVCRCGRPIKAE